ncbi:MAG: hypothetical protein IPK02_04565 [Candidatus Accumulibacter sp.]|uniref:Glycosyltransferase 2-like domain-containing protein n=1 Tax=Candidatus Accumulibacter affinis TaxID=2954384 RepID=A0A935T9A7_9PROT|nr:hypothetical protein [Candidatus Accumulibacter affinis]
MFDITVTVMFHREGAYALPALSSMQEMVSTARAAGLRVECRAVLDCADAHTKQIVLLRGAWLDEILEVSFGDLGLSRNHGVIAARGQFLAFLDGDDLWGDDWLVLAHLAATALGVPEAAIWHPESLFYFNDGDFDRHSKTRQPSAAARAFHLFLRSSDDPGFDRNALLLNNLWSANVLAARALHLRFPYQAVSKDRGFGIEDWAWNIETVWAEIRHLVVPDTIHLIRVKESGSLGQQNSSEGLLVRVPVNVWPKLGSHITP